MTKHEQIREDQDDRAERELKDLDVPAHEAADVKAGLRVKPIERDPTVAGQFPPSK